MDKFQTILKPGEALIREKGSKFYGYVGRVDDVKAFQKWLEEIQGNHPSARHFCFAYRLGATGEEERANDDGEPSGTAGLPILNQLKSFETVNTALIVVRYFGGTKLGASGLISAYKQTAQEALQSSTIGFQHLLKKIEIQFDYGKTSEVLRVLHEWQVEILDQNHAAKTTYTVGVKPSVELDFLNQLRQIYPIRIRDYD